MFKHNLLDLHIRHIASFLKVGRGRLIPERETTIFKNHENQNS